jgi:hypothetical protein
MLALGLYYKSPAAYRFLQRQFCLPSAKTLHSYISLMTVMPGFNSDYVQVLRHRAQSLSELERYVILLFDSMSLQCALKYTEHNDKINGFTDLSGFAPSSKDVAKTALQFLVRGTSTKWKHPLGHFFASHAVPPCVLQQMIKAAIDLLHSMQLHVVAVVCDQEAGHRVCYREMGVTVDKPWITCSTGIIVSFLYTVFHYVGTSLIFVVVFRNIGQF